MLRDSYPAFFFLAPCVQPVLEVSKLRKCISYIHPRLSIFAKRLEGIPLVGPYHLARHHPERQRRMILLPLNSMSIRRPYVLNAVLVIHLRVAAVQVLIFTISIGILLVIMLPPMFLAQPIFPALRIRPRRAQSLLQRTCQQPSLRHLWTKDPRLGHVRYHMSSRIYPRLNVTKDLRYQPRAVLLPRLRRPKGGLAGCWETLSERSDRT